MGELIKLTILLVLSIMLPSTIFVIIIVAGIKIAFAALYWLAVTSWS